MDKIYLLNQLRWYYRLPAKWFVLGLTLLAVCFPYPNRLIRHIDHWLNMNALVDPDAESIQPWLTELRPQITDDLSPTQALRTVESFVYKKVPYAWDWDNWGVVDYLPTVDEVVEKGMEDCDGRAVVAASLLTSLGYKAELVTDYAHMWVKTDQGETMSPGKTKVMVSTKKGKKFNFSGFMEIPKASAYGVAIFPLIRELIVAGVLWLLLIRNHGGRVCNLITLSVFTGGLLLLRLGGKNYHHPVYWQEGLGALVMLLAIIILILWSRKNVLHSSDHALSGNNP